MNYHIQTMKPPVLDYLNLKNIASPLGLAQSKSEVCNISLKLDI